MFTYLIESRADPHMITRVVAENMSSFHRIAPKKRTRERERYQIFYSSAKCIREFTWHLKIIKW